jgi:hypothetical protein
MSRPKLTPKPDPKTALPRVPLAIHKAGQDEIWLAGLLRELSL